MAAQLLHQIAVLHDQVAILLREIAYQDSLIAALKNLLVHWH
jgi:hypothetical protein